MITVSARSICSVPAVARTRTLAEVPLFTSTAGTVRSCPPLMVNKALSVLPVPPTVRRVRTGSAGSETEPPVNELQALHLPPDFRGTYFLRWNYRVSKLLGIEDGPDEIVLRDAGNNLHKLTKSKITKRESSPVSMMPPGLLNALNPDELLDLYAYILSGGNPNDPRF